MSETTTKKRPLYDAFGASKEGEKVEWTKVGAIWPNAKGITLVLNDGVTVVLEDGAIVFDRIVGFTPRKPDNPEAPHK